MCVAPSFLWRNGKSFSIKIFFPTNASKWWVNKQHSKYVRIFSFPIFCHDSNFFSSVGITNEMVFLLVQEISAKNQRKEESGKKSFGTFCDWLAQHVKNSMNNLRWKWCRKNNMTDKRGALLLFLLFFTLWIAASE